MAVSAAMPTPSSFETATGDGVVAGVFEIAEKYLKTADANWNTETRLEEAQIDSLDFVELVFEIEDRFGIELNFNANAQPVGEMTFGTVVALIRTALDRKARTA
jgi:acyl carrier protein